MGMPPSGCLAEQGYQGLKARSVNVGQAKLARVSVQKAKGARAQQADSVSSVDLALGPRSSRVHFAELRGSVVDAASVPPLEHGRGEPEAVQQERTRSSRASKGAGCGRLMITHPKVSPALEQLKG